MTLGLLALPAHAQNWATRELCNVTEPKVHVSSFAPSSFEDIQTAGAQIENGVGKFWRITSPGGAVSHLWGTVHSNSPVLLKLPDELKTAISDARIVAVERDFVMTSREEVYDYFTRNRFGSYAESGFSELDLPFDLQLWIRARFTGLGWGGDAVDYLPLHEIVEILLFDPCSDFADGTYPIQDSRIQMLGAIAGAEILGLETKDALTEKMISDDNGDLTRAMIGLYGAYLNPNISNEDISTYFAFYQQGRLGEWMAWERSYMSGVFPDQVGLDWLDRTDAFLLTERNVNFVKTALPELEQGDMVIAVGAFHLPGATGLIEMLRGAGYLVERVAVEGEITQ